MVEDKDLQLLASFMPSFVRVFRVLNVFAKCATQILWHIASFLVCIAVLKFLCWELIFWKF